MEPFPGRRRGINWDKSMHSVLWWKSHHMVFTILFSQTGLDEKQKVEYHISSISVCTVRNESLWCTIPPNNVSMRPIQESGECPNKCSKPAFFPHIPLMSQRKHHTISLMCEWERMPVTRLCLESLRWSEPHHWECENIGSSKYTINQY